MHTSNLDIQKKKKNLKKIYFETYNTKREEGM